MESEYFWIKCVQKGDEIECCVIDEDNVSHLHCKDTCKQKKSGKLSSVK